MATSVHATAVVEPGAELDDGCVIGPFCHVGAHVRLGAGTRLHSHVVVAGHTRIGSGGEVFPFACVGAQSQDLKYTGEVTYVEIGSGTTLREYVTVHAATDPGTSTHIGCDCHILAYCHIAHDCILGDRVIMSNACQLAGHVIVEDQAVFGGMAGVHQFVRVGRLAMISATAKVVQDVLPYALVNGSPALPVTINRIGMERNGLTDDTVRAVDRAFRMIFRSGMTLATALHQLATDCAGVEAVEHMIAFARQSQRGLARPKSG